MRPKFLLDAHISPDVAAGCRARGLDVKALFEVTDVDAEDESILRLAMAEGRIVVTYDNGDFARMLADAIRTDIGVPGVLFVSHRTIPASDFGGLVKALLKMAEKIARGEVDPSGGVFLRR